MFYKPKPTAPAKPDVAASTAPDKAAPAPAKSRIAPSRGMSVLSADLQLEGTVTSGGDLQIDGTMKGDVRVGRLFVGETGSIEGNVTAEELEVRGRIVGAVTGKQVRLISTAYVDGDITAEQLSIDIGAYFQGRVLQSRREAPAPIPPAPRAAPVPAASRPEAAPVATPTADKLQPVDLKPA